MLHGAVVPEHMTAEGANTPCPGHLHQPSKERPAGPPVLEVVGDGQGKLRHLGLAGKSHAAGHPDPDLLIPRTGLGAAGNVVLLVGFGQVSKLCVRQFPDGSVKAEISGAFREPLEAPSEVVAVPRSEEPKDSRCPVLQADGNRAAIAPRPSGSGSDGCRCHEVSSGSLCRGRTLRLAPCRPSDGPR